MYNSIVDQIPNYHKKKEKISEIQEFKVLNIPMAQSKPSINCKYPIQKVKINEELGIIVIVTANNEILLFYTNGSEKVDPPIQQAPEKQFGEKHHVDKLTALDPSKFFINPAVEWIQEHLLVMDEQNLGIYDFGAKGKPPKVVRKKLTVSLNSRIVDIISVFNSPYSGLLVVTEKGHIHDFSTKYMRPVCSLTLAGKLVTEDKLNSSDDLEQTVPTSSKKSVAIPRTNSISVQVGNLGLKPFLDYSCKSIVSFCEDGKITVV